MHEASIAQNIIEIAIRISGKYNAKKINRITIVVGELNFLDYEALKFAFKALSENTPIENAELIIEEAPAKFKCLKCDYEWTISLSKYKNDKALHFAPELILGFLECPKCKSNEIEIIGGRELYVKDIELTT